MKGEKRGLRMRNLVTLLVTLVLLLAGILLIVWPAQMAAESRTVEVLQTLGSFVTVSIILGFLYQVTIRKHDDEVVEARLRQLLDERIDFMIQGRSRYGFEGFLAGIDFSEIFDSLGNQDTLWWLDTYDPNHHDWLDSLEAALRRGATVNVLVMHPDSPLAELRADELGKQYKGQRFRNALNSFRESLKLVQKNCQDMPGKLEIVEYLDLPGAPIYVVCHRDVPVRGYSSMFLSKPTAIRFPHLQWRPSEGDFLGALYHYVVEKWQRNKPPTQG